VFTALVRSVDRLSDSVNVMAIELPGIIAPIATESDRVTVRPWPSDVMPHLKEKDETSATFLKGM